MSSLRIVGLSFGKNLGFMIAFPRRNSRLAWSSAVISSFLSKLQRALVLSKAPCLTWGFEWPLRLRLRYDRPSFLLALGHSLSKIRKKGSSGYILNNPTWILATDSSPFYPCRIVERPILY